MTDAAGMPAGMAGHIVSDYWRRNIWAYYNVVMIHVWCVMILNSPGCRVSC